MPCYWKMFDTINDVNCFYSDDMGGVRVNPLLIFSSTFMTEKSSLWIVMTGGNQHTEIHAIYIYIFFF